ncbi:MULTISPECIES: hypothetical protein [Methanobacterium]|jgi:hypothetical protein|uniref:Uncharacterized protein n=1 Tax=Methanobacterium veterum TaxID=408577 RepID=A0A9E4ZV54_9EURY|nr:MULTISPECIES: hypothetical protein [Methanobacterium]MCZ3365596.1 hypothetical protein [Methanobacterium veterum]MCZ3371059.1 hypothetical protein [Methanobacterium veterum]
MPDIITTIKDPEDIHFILKKKEIEAENVIILTKGDIHGLLNVEREGYSIKFLEGDFFEILHDIKCVFDLAPEPCFIAGENELDIYVTYYLAQLQKTIPFYVLDNNNLILLPLSTSHAFTHVKKQIMEYLHDHEQSKPDDVVSHLTRESGFAGKKNKYSKLTINQYLHELESADLVNSEGNKYSLNDKGSRFMEILK